MSFWQSLEGGNGTAEIGGSEPIPAGTQLVAMIDEAKHDEYDGERYVSLRWAVLDGPFKNRKVFHKLKVYQKDEQKANKARQMLGAIDVNAGGNLRKLGREPSDGELLMAVGMKPMLIKVGVWKLDDGREGNWIQSVSPASAKPVAQQPEAGSSELPGW